MTSKKVLYHIHINVARFVALKTNFFLCCLSMNILVCEYFLHSSVSTRRIYCCCNCRFKIEQKFVCLQFSLNTTFFNIYFDRQNHSLSHVYRYKQNTYDVFKINVLDYRYFRYMNFVPFVSDLL